MFRDTYLIKLISWEVCKSPLTTVSMVIVTITIVISLKR